MSVTWCDLQALSKKINCIYLFFNFSPYSSADLRLMASSFNTTLASLEDELMTLILDGKIQARIDSHNKVRKLNWSNIC